MDVVKIKRTFDFSVPDVLQWSFFKKKKFELSSRVASLDLGPVIGKKETVTDISNFSAQ